MLTGAAPFADRAPHQVFAAHMNDVPMSVSAKRPDVPRALAAVVMRCLEKDPASRPQSARDVLSALDAGDAGVRSYMGPRAEAVAGTARTRDS